MSAKTHEPVQSLWIGGKLSTMERLAIRSFLANGHPYHLYTYGDVEGVPDGTTILDGRGIVGEDRIFRYSEAEGGGYAGFADVFRFNLLDQRGGWWVDTDVVCLRPFDHEAELVVSSSWEGKWGQLPNSCILRIPAGSRLAGELVAATSKVDGGSVGFGAIGPLLVQRLVRDLRLESHVVPYWHFCPVVWRRLAETIALPEATPRIEIAKFRIKEAARRFLRPANKLGRIERGSYAVHLWNEMWRRQDLDKNGGFHPSAIYEQLKRRYPDDAGA